MRLYGTGELESNDELVTSNEHYKFWVKRSREDKVFIDTESFQEIPEPWICEHTPRAERPDPPRFICSKCGITMRPTGWETA